MAFPRSRATKGGRSRSSCDAYGSILLFALTREVTLRTYRDEIIVALRRVKHCRAFVKTRGISIEW